MKNLVMTILLVLALALVSFGQTNLIQSFAKVENSPAYKVLVSQQTKVESELTALRKIYTDKHPDVLAKKAELNILTTEMAKVLWIEANKYNQLTDYFGKLVLEKVATELELNRTLTRFTAKHPLVQQKTQAVALAESQIAEYFKN